MNWRFWESKWKRDEREFNRACHRMGVPYVEEITGLESLYIDVRWWIARVIFGRPQKQGVRQPDGSWRIE